MRLFCKHEAKCADVIHDIEEACKCVSPDHQGLRYYSTAFRKCDTNKDKGMFTPLWMKKHLKPKLKGKLPLPF